MPVAILICIGFWVAKLGVISEPGAQDLTRLTFNVLAPALLFHTMTQVHLHELNITPILLYFFIALSLFAASISVLGFTRKSTVLGLAGTYSNTTMIGVPLIGLVYGAPGLVYLFTLISLHAIILLTTATIVLEFSLLSETVADQNPDVTESSNPWYTVGKALRNAIIHPVPLPIVAGIIFSYFGWQLPKLIEEPVIWIGLTFSPIALLLVGISLYSATYGRKLSNTHELRHSENLSVWKIAGALTLIKNLVNPILVLGIGHLVGVQGLALSVMVLAASMPIGANVFLFSQRYRVSQSEITIAVSTSTIAALATVPLVMWLNDLMA